MNISENLTVLADGYAFTECPHWHEGRLWFVDMHLEQVCAVDEDGTVETIVNVPGPTGGIGWLPDGRLLVVAMEDRKILRLEASGLVVHADLSETVSTTLNDLWVDSKGRAYVGETGFNAREFLQDPAAVEAVSTGAVAGLEVPATSRIFVVEPDGTWSEAASGLRFTNGIIVDEEAGLLFVAETFGGCLSRYEIGPDGSLSNRQLLPLEFLPDGIGLDRSGCVWVTDLVNSAVQRIDPQGAFLERIATSQLCLAAAVGGPDGETLYLCTSPTLDLKESLSLRGSRVESVSLSSIV